MVEPWTAGGQTGVHPVPGQGLGLAVAAGVAGRGLLGGVPGVRFGEGEDTAVLAGLSAARGGTSGAGVAEHHPVRAQPADQLEGQVGQDVGEAGDVVAGVHDDDDVRVAGPPLPGVHEPGEDITDLGGGHRGGVVGRPEPDRVQHGRPRGTSCFQGGDEGVGPAGDELIRAAASPVDVAEQQLGSGGSVGPQPVAHVHREDDPPVGGTRQRGGGQQPAQAARFQPAVVDRVVHRPVPTPVLSAASVNSTSEVTGPSEHSTASVSSKSASARV